MNKYNSKVSKILLENGVEKIKFYFHTTSIVNNIFTACLMFDSSNNLISRGVSICSPIDVFKKLSGRGKAFGRAVQALKLKANSESIDGWIERWDGQFVIKSIKVKNEIEENIISSNISEELASFYGSLYNFIKKENINSKKCSKKITFKIPRNYAIWETRKFFKYKSEYKPEPAVNELSYMS